MQLQTSVYEPVGDEKLRQDFVLGVKLLVNGRVQNVVREVCQQETAPAVKALGREPSRAALAVPLSQTLAFRQWAALTHSSQSMMWRAIEATTQRVANAAAQRFAALPPAAQRAGSLELDPRLDIPHPIGDTEIHRQPVGYVSDGSPNDLTAGLRYLGSGQIYSPGKGASGAGLDARGLQLAKLIKERFAGIKPKRILDLGCGMGMSTHGMAREFPGVEIHGVDVAPGLLRFGHLFAEEQGTPIHYKQRDAATTGYPDGYFDLVVSSILFHETNHDKLPAVLRECRRVLASGGVMFHLDVATQVAHQSVADQIMNEWQVRWNGEPFWMGFAETDMKKSIIAAGFDSTSAFADYAGKPGGGQRHIFGARG
mgnify:CR=1 FL=1